MSPSSDLSLGCTDLARVPPASRRASATRRSRSRRSSIPARVATDHRAVLEALPAIPIGASPRRGARLLRETGGKDWAELYRDERSCAASPRRPTPASRPRRSAGKREEVDRLVREIGNGSATTRWRSSGTPAPVSGDRLPEGAPRMDLPALLEKVIILHSHIEHQLFSKDDAELRKVAQSLATLLQSGNYQLIRDAFIAATETEGRNIANVLRINRSLPRDVRDKAIANMLRTRPELAKQVEGDARSPAAAIVTIDPDVIYTTSDGLFRRQKEYEDLVNVKIPENAAEIGKAASYGDLSENAEWSAAIESSRTSPGSPRSSAPSSSARA